MSDAALESMTAEHLEALFLELRQRANSR
jgi:hypothetical protein